MTLLLLGIIFLISIGSTSKQGKVHLLAVSSIISSSIPKACRDAQCVVENEWINEDDPYTPSRLNDSGKCHHNGIKSEFAVDFVDATCLHDINKRYKARKLLALRQIEWEHLMICEDAQAGCSLKRRIKAMLSCIVFWHHCCDKQIEYYFGIGEGIKSMWLFNNNYQPTVIAPLFFICHSINVVVLNKMLVDDKTAIVFQLAEVISDMSSCLFATLFPACLHVFAAYCTRVDMHRTLYPNGTWPVFQEAGFGDWHYLDRYPTWEIMLNAVSGFQIANQLFNLYLLISRWYCITNGAKYMVISQSKKTAMTVILLTVAGCVFIAFWPAPPIHVRDYKGRDWYYIWHMYPLFKGSEVIKLLIETKVSFVVVSYLGLIIAQVVFAVLCFKRYKAYMRSDVRLANETAAQAVKRKALEKDKTSLMTSTLVVNWICMTPTLLVMYAKTLDIQWDTVGVGSAYILGVFQALQLIASGFNAIGAFGAHLMFTKSYRRAFHAVFIGRFMTNRVSALSANDTSKNPITKNTTRRQGGTQAQSRV